ncbi:MAG: hypothetical protein KKC79_11285 [Gammaproteobacteria bacterium]|nr:hypothetical protein [Gammaproteobacteria bacterium]MBU1443855.1 hypothetical protein [Gammaproteobacteria bacterium]MBU2287326.1 hypothetical protein [Gammaproteobacteria bacterium]MBU2409213.1 hypothetical protein [Gammaproteobacteria bacterium]
MTCQTFPSQPFQVTGRKRIDDRRARQRFGMVGIDARGVPPRTADAILFGAMGLPLVRGADGTICPVDIACAVIRRL